MKKFLIKLIIVSLIGLIIAAAVELTLFVNDDAFWESFEKPEEEEGYYDYYDRY